MAKKPVKKPRGYWQNFDNLRNELLLIIKQLGHFPNHRELAELKQYMLAISISTHHKGYNNVRLRMGYPVGRVVKGQYNTQQKPQNNVETRAADLPKTFNLESIASLPGTPDYSEREFLETYEGGDRSD